jgi:hypothetical protein
MSKKKTISKQMYIAIDNNRDEVIAMGVLGDLIKAIEEHIDMEDYDSLDVENIKVFELGKEKMVLAHTRFDITIGE